MDFLPAHGALFADALGYLYVEDYRLPGEEVPTFNVFDPQGRLTGRLQLPAGLQVLEVGEDYLLGLYRDELDVEYLRLYALERPDRG